MIFIKYQIESEEKAKVVVQNFIPEKTGILTDEDAASRGGILVSTIPNSLQDITKSSELYINPITKEFWYEYADMPKTQEEIITGLQYQNAQMIMALVQGGLM